ncbi:hypothetical protein D9615_007925 [Tricholomella constricta]|uniref:DUF6534 domain-containing protein n=1 Tax=Tricholomella constricta TaxID=117010 RepID=A0A8H5LZR0_9AGAR|nr:hypothetical protein D9615_007925 [Tricholomella constricta]
MPVKPLQFLLVPVPFSSHEMDEETRARYIEGILGPHEVGVMFAIFLFGLVTIQAFTYFQKYPEDPRAIKTLVTTIWTLLFIHTLISAFSLYRRTVKDYGKMSNFDNYPQAMCGAFSLSGLIGSIVQSFFAYRLRKLSGRSGIAIVCWTLSIVRFGSVVCISVTTCRATSVHDYVNRWKWLVVFALTISAIVDFLIAGSLSYCLWTRRKDVFTHAQRVVDKLIAWTIQTGILTSLSSILMLVLYSAIQNFAWVAAYLVISGLFANYLLASLNARNGLRDDMNRKPTFFDIETLPDFVVQPQCTLRTITAEGASYLGPSSRPPGFAVLPLRPHTM